MAADEPNLLAAALGGRSTRLGDVPDDIQRRYFTDGRGGGLGYYLDATSPTPVFRDRGDRLTAARNDPNAIRHMVRIAQHRDWTVVLVRGAPEFRREAWLAGRLADLDVRGYRPTARDVQELQRRLDAARRRDIQPLNDRLNDAHQRPRDRGPDDAGARSRLRAVEAVVRARVPNTVEQDRILASARDRIAKWLERGARFDPVKLAERDASQSRSRSR
ncbi:LPD7 domain-containing protein [Phenylobacterium sp.]|uniref:LPD7 domain-containing protein n=1 Tax=Phenylobacterium sp. TaxID=1871053 RepID=UPI0035613F44